MDDRTIVENLRVTIPPAMDLGNLQIAAREYTMTIYPLLNSGVRMVTINGIDYTPGFIPVQLWILEGGNEVGQIAGNGGHIEFIASADGTAPLTFSIFNLSQDAPANMTIHLQGLIYVSRS